MREFGRKSDMSLDKVHVNETLKRAHEVLNQQLTLRGIDVIWALEEDLPKVSADSLKLEQVFLNLLLNARDAIEESWQSSGDKTGKGEITLKSGYEGGMVKVEVCDNGAGILNAIKDKIFEPFFTTKKVGKGTGLGLSISYGIIKECGGSIKAVSETEAGSCFVIELPVAGTDQKEKN
jgi:histidine kinase